MQRTVSYCVEVHSVQSGIAGRRESTQLPLFMMVPISTIRP